MTLQRRRNSGATLLELVVTIVVAGLTAGLIFSGYTLVVRLWNNHNHKMEASGGAWVTYLKIDRLMSESYSLKKAFQNKWVFYRNPTDSCVLTYENKSLVSSDSVVRNKADIDSFYLDIVDTDGVCPVWQCGFVYSQGLTLSGMSWRTVCRGEYISAQLPTPLRTSPVQADLYWDNKGK